VLSPYIKATSAGVAAAIAALIAGTMDNSSISLYEGLVALGAFVGIWNTTFFVPYSPLNNNLEGP